MQSVHRMRSGLGDGQGIPVLSPSITTGIAAGGGVATAAIIGSSLAVPIIGAAIAGVTLAIGLWLNRLGPKQKVATTKIVNEAEPLLKQNLDAWNNSSKTSEEQTQAIANFQNIWAAVVNNCAQEQFGNPGHACIEDRMPVGMQVTVGGNTFIGNGKWDWFSYYLYPIQNDPHVQSNVGGAMQSLSSFFDSAGGSSPMMLIGIALLALGGWAMMESSS